MWKKESVGISKNVRYWGNYDADERRTQHECQTLEQRRPTLPLHNNYVKLKQSTRLCSTTTGIGTDQIKYRRY